MKRLWSLSFFLLLMFPHLVRAESPVVISEIAWAGSSASNADEWFELYNTTGADIDLSDWRMLGAGTSGSELVFPEGSVISASGTFIVSNYDIGHEKTVLGVTPQWVTTSVALSNSALELSLQDAGGNVIDTAGDGSAPLAGMSGDEKHTMERLFPVQDGSLSEAWTSSETEAGTPGAILMIVAEPDEETEGVPESSEGGGVAVDPLKTSIRISELYPAPMNGEEEWVELENISSVGEFLKGWTVEDAGGDATELDGLILPWSKHVIHAPKGHLNNSGDTVFLKDSQGRVVDAVSYGKAVLNGFPHGTAPKRGQSLMREELRNTYLTTTTPTEGGKNIFTDPNPPKVKPAPKPVTPPKPSPTPAPAPTITEASEPKAVQAQKETPVPAPKVTAVETKTSKPVVQKTVATKRTTAKKSRYKGRSYVAKIAVPPGVYSKARMRVMTGGVLQELRLTKSPTGSFRVGEEVGFIAQEKKDGDHSYLLANIKTLYKTGKMEEIAFAETKRWPSVTGPYELTGIVEEANGKMIQIRAGEKTGIVESPASYKQSGLTSGDVVSVKGYYEHGEFPRFVMLDSSSLRVLEPVRSVETPEDRKTRLPLPVTVALTAGILGIGLMVYLRTERLKRMHP